MYLQHRWNYHALFGAVYLIFAGKEESSNDKVSQGSIGVLRFDPDYNCSLLQLEVQWPPGASCGEDGRRCVNFGDQYMLPGVPKPTAQESWEQDHPGCLFCVTPVSGVCDRELADLCIRHLLWLFCKSNSQPRLLVLSHPLLRKSWISRPHQLCGDCPLEDD